MTRQQAISERLRRLVAGWPPDRGARDACQNGGGNLDHRAGAAQPVRRLMTMPVHVRLRGVTWTPDGSALVIAKQEAPSDIVLFELDQR